MKRVNLLLLCLLLLLATLGLYRQLLDGRSFRSRDHFDFYLRVHQYRAELAEGHWPQTLPDAVRGGGHAFPVFYPPASQMAAVGVHLLVGDIVRATHLAALAALLLSLLGLFALVHHLTGSPSAAAVAAAAFAAFPYRFTLLFERGAFAESWALAWYPLVVLGGLLALQRGRVPAWWPVVIAALVLSHVAMALWVLPVLGLVLLAAAKREDRMRLTGLGLAAAAWAAGLAAFYVLPVLARLGTVRAADPVVMLSEPGQVAAAGLAGIWPGWPVLNLITFVAGAGYLIVVIRRRPVGFLLRLATFLLVALIGLAAMLAAPERVWSLVPQPLRYIQFPWRLLGPIAFLGSVALGILATRMRSWLAAVAVVLFLGMGWVVGGISMVPREYTGRELEGLLRTGYPDLGLTLAGDYLPRESDPASLALTIQRTREGVGGDQLLSWTPFEGEWRATVETPEAALVPLPLVAYDFHHITTAEGDPLPTGSVGGQVVVRVEPGRTEIRVARRMPAPLVAGLFVSLATAVLLAVRSRRTRPWISLPEPT